ncbi:hypothetical protein, partial [Escherichia coli]|uniref:hypothetical protein n=1 Tax=Escherichia coli TaxID=562 RepID=UPI001BC8D2C4
VTLKMPAFEWVHVQLHQQKGMISLSPPTICNSAIKRSPAVTKPVTVSIQQKRCNKIGWQNDNRLCA